MTDIVLTHSYHLLQDARPMCQSQPYAPLGTLYAAAALQAANISVAIFDSTFEDPAQSFRAFLRHHRPVIVVIYEDDFNFFSRTAPAVLCDTTLCIAKIAREASNVVIAHGAAATDHADQYLRNGADYVLTGQAETSLVDLCGRLLNARDISGVSGLLRLDDQGRMLHGTMFDQPSSGWVELSRVARELIDMQPYRQMWLAKHGYFSANVVAGRGGPVHDGWGTQPTSGSRVNLRSPESVASEVRELKELYEVDHIWFCDNVFALDRDWIEEFAEEMKQQQAVLPFKVQSRAELMSEQTVNALVRAGCAEVWMGTDCDAQKLVLDPEDKIFQPAQFSDARERLRRAGIRTCTTELLPLPGFTSTNEFAVVGTGDPA